MTNTTTETIERLSPKPLVRRSSLETIRELKDFFCKQELRFPALVIHAKEFHSTLNLVLLQLLSVLRSSEKLRHLLTSNVIVAVIGLFLLGQIFAGLALAVACAPPFGFWFLAASLMVFPLIAAPILLAGRPEELQLYKNKSL